jgi:hypothetical protein
MSKYQAPPSSFHFKRASTDGLVLVLNEGWYVMAEYSERTGEVKWQRVVLATQREKIEKYLREQYPIQSQIQSPIQSPAARSPKINKRR